MQRRFLFSALFSLTSLSLAGLAQAQAPMPLRVLTHSSFDLPKELLAQFEKDAGVKLQIVKAGDAGEMTNKLILNKARPIADVAYGIDNTLLLRALRRLQLHRLLRKRPTIILNLKPIQVLATLRRRTVL